MAIELEVDDQGLKSAAGTAEADIDSILTEFPEGVTANPSAAVGLEGCSPAQYNAESWETPVGGGCPQASKIGTVEAETPILEGRRFHGSLYLAAPDSPLTPQQGAENQFDALLALYLVIRDAESGVFVKQAGEVTPDPVTGRLRAVFDDLPPFPLSHVTVELRSGPRAPLVTPSSCGSYRTAFDLAPSSGAASRNVGSDFSLTAGPDGSACPVEGNFVPGLEAGSLSNAAATFSPFSIRLVRQDGEEELRKLSLKLPTGVTGKLAGVAKCPDASVEAAKAKTGKQETVSPSCPESSKIGRVVGGAGVGSALTYVDGTIYLAGPYEGAPLSIAAVVPAVAGPFDLGTVVVRQGLRLDPITAQVEVDGESASSIPRILRGVPVRLRDLRVEIDRPNFMLNPSSCAEKTITGTAHGEASSAALQSRYQAASCASLGFKPKLKVALKGGTARSMHPSLRSVLTPRRGDANLREALVTLPHTQFIDQSRINQPCTRVQFAVDQCPPGSVLGKARAFSPLLDEPLEGPIYFRSNGGDRELPDIVLDLRGLFRITVVGFVSAKNARIRTKFANLPDAALSKVVINLKGGKNGLLVNSANLCKANPHVLLSLKAHNGRTQRTNPVLATDCPRSAKADRNG